jgi:hypothetical protein
VVAGYFVEVFTFERVNKIFGNLVKFLSLAGFLGFLHKIAGANNYIGVLFVN